MSAAAPPPTPTIIAARYELQRRLAQGGMAEVWLATDLVLDRKVAVKWLKPSLANDPIVAERFRREAIAAASLSHPNIVAVHDVFESEGRLAVVMQFVVDALEHDRVAWTCTDNGNPVWVGTELEWSFAEEDGGTRVDFSHRGLKMPGSPPYQATVETWPMFLQSLKAWVETGTGRPW